MTVVAYSESLLFVVEVGPIDPSEIWGLLRRELIVGDFLMCAVLFLLDFIDDHMSV